MTRTQRERSQPANVSGNAKPLSAETMLGEWETTSPTGEERPDLPHVKRHDDSNSAPASGRWSRIFSPISGLRLPFSTREGSPAVPDNRVDDLDSIQSNEQHHWRLNTPKTLSDGSVLTTDKKTEFTILLVGETGVGKTTFLSLLGNVLKGKRPDQYDDYHVSDNERGGSQSESQTKDAKVYPLTSNNGVTFQILDSPGLADTRGLAQDDQHKASIAKAIEDNLTSVNAVLILANGTVPRLGYATDYTLSTLSSIFPRTLSENIALMFTNVGTIGSFNFDPDFLPDILKNSEQYLLDNPVAIQKKYVEKKRENFSPKILNELRDGVIQGERKALDTLCDFFDWIDSRKAQPTQDILSLYQQSQEIDKNIQNTLARMQQANARKNQVELLKKEAESAKNTMKLFKNFEYTMKKDGYIQVPMTYHSTLCSKPACYSNCHDQCSLSFSLDPSQLAGCYAMQPSGACCKVCGHGRDDHRHYNTHWKKEGDEKKVDEDSRRKFLAAKSEKERKESLIKVMQEAVDRLTNDIQELTTEIGRLLESYASLSLSGSFSGQVQKSIRMVELHLEKMRCDGSSTDSVKTVEDGLSVLKGKQKVLEVARSGKSGK